MYAHEAFKIAPGHSGYSLNGAYLRTAVLSALQRGGTALSVSTTALPIPRDDPHLIQNLQALQKKLGNKIGFVYGGRTIEPTKATIGSWFRASGVSMAVAETVVEPYVTGELAHQFNVTVANPIDLATATAYAINSGDSVNLTVTAAASSTVTLTYCTAVDQESPSVLGELTGKLAETYNDARGWNNGGKIAFKHVSSGCQYTVWIAAPSQMTTFGAICDNYYNCQVGTNVILNYDRWMMATPPWNKTGGSLSNYHTLMIDHETGHRLGFADNPTCPGLGQPAPVMMQQSVDLKGCVFNTWPRPAELTRLDQMLGTSATTQSQSE